MIKKIIILILTSPVILFGMFISIISEGISEGMDLGEDVFKKMIGRR